MTCGCRQTPPPARPRRSCDAGCGCQSCQACEPCEACAPPPCEPPRRVLKWSQRIKINPRIAGTEFPPAVCPCDSPLDITRLEAWIRRRGTCAWLLRYPAWDVTDRGWALFRWDAQLYNLPPGRYEAEIRQDGCPCGVVELVIGPECRLDLRRHEAFVIRQSQTPPTEPADVFPVFEPLYTFSARLCAILERGTTVLPLCPEDLAVLCAATLCKPVELQISDGTVTELVMFAGCVDGVAQVTRGTPQVKFPVHAVISFVWSPYNATAALTPCR